MSVVDARRYGRFDYAAANEIPDDGYIELPASATDITLFRSGAGHWAKFSIDTPTLGSWIDERLSLRPDLNNSHDANEWAPKATHSQPPDTLELNQQIFGDRFPDTGWIYDPAMLEIQISRSDRGGGYTVWHVPSNGDTYISAGYW